MEEDKPGMHRNASSQIFINAKELRRNPTRAEILVWDNFLLKRPLGYKFRFQHPFFMYILDFYCHKLRLAIEIDGNVHEEHFQKMYDHERDLLLREEGLEVLRISNDKVFFDFENVVSFVLDRISKREKELF